MAAIRDKFDFEVGYLVKSPCTQCDLKDTFPKCFDTCNTLDTVREKLTRAVSTYKDESK